MGRALANGGNQRAKLLEKWKGGGDDWHVEIDEIEYNKLVVMKRKAESSLLGEQKPAKVEAELQEEKGMYLWNMYERT